MIRSAMNLSELINYERPKIYQYSQQIQSLCDDQ